MHYRLSNRYRRVSADGSQPAEITATTLAVIKWIEANSGLVTAIAATIAGTAALGAALIVIGIAAKGAAAGFAVIQTAIKGFTFLQKDCQSGRRKVH